jgi:threonine/homoserine/homoserine lactone efflux protein
MIGIHDFPLFLASGILLNLIPGPDTAYILSRSVGQGREAGVASALGIAVGSVVHTCAAAFGLSAFIASAAWAFTTLKLIGGSYLIFLGIKLIVEKDRSLGLPSESPRNATIAAAFRQGFLTNLLNPKVALFFLAFLPQFIDRAAPHKVTAFMLLGVTFVTTGTIWCLVLALGAAHFTQHLRRSGDIGFWLRRATGGVFIFLGSRLATAR